MKNVVIRGYLVKSVYGIYIHGIKTMVESPYHFIGELREGLTQEIIKEHLNNNQGQLSPSWLERAISPKLLLKKRWSRVWWGQCPYSTRKDMPFEHGCQIYTYGTPLDVIDEGFTFFLIGKNNCRRLKDCAIDLAEKVGMNPEINYLKGSKYTSAYIKATHAIEDLRNLH